MHRAVLTLLVGLMLSLNGGASALTFGKDGKQEMPALIPDNLTPQELLDTVDANDKLLKIIEEGGMAGPLVYDYEWNRCSLISHNLELLFEKCPLSQKDRRVVVKAKRNKLLRKFQCGFEGFQRHMSNATPTWLFKRRAVNRCAERVKFTLDEYARLEKIIQRSVSEINNYQTPPELLAPVDSQNKLLTLLPGIHALNTDYSQEWNLCNLISHNIYLIVDKCNLGNEARTALTQAKKDGVLKKFQCGLEGYKRFLRNKGQRWKYDYASANCSDGRTQFTVDEYARLEKIIQGSGSEIVDSELKPEPLQPEAELAAPKVQDKQHEQTISPDIEAPLITILSQSSNGPKGTLKGRVTDNTGLAGVTVDGKSIDVESNGNFLAIIYVPEGGVSITIEAFDLAGLSSSMSIRIERDLSNSTTALDFDRLNPIAREAATNPNALALIIGLEEYEKTDAKAAYADSDASVFADYAALKLGVPQRRIKTLVNEGADISDVLLSVQDWLSRAVKQEQSDVYIFFAGHGLASDDGEKMYLLPYDGSPRLLSRTALLRDELFADIAAANPRSVTVFLDTCYSGTTRGPDMLIASRPIAIRAKEQAVPDGFTVMTAAAGDQTAKPLEEAKHGMFSYFLMKGMEGDADANQDNQITARELQEYVYQNVVQQSSGSQTPELQGDADRVLVRFQ